MQIVKFDFIFQFFYFSAIFLSLQCKYFVSLNRFRTSFMILYFINFIEYKGQQPVEVDSSLLISGIPGIIKKMSSAYFTLSLNLVKQHYSKNSAKLSCSTYGVIDKVWLRNHTLLLELSCSVKTNSFIRAP